MSKAKVSAIVQEVIGLLSGEVSPRATAKINATAIPNARASFLVKVRDTCGREHVSFMIPTILLPMETEAGLATISRK